MCMYVRAYTRSCVVHVVHVVHVLDGACRVVHPPRAPRSDYTDDAARLLSALSPHPALLKDPNEQVRWCLSS